MVFNIDDNQKCSFGLCPFKMTKCVFTDNNDHYSSLQAPKMWPNWPITVKMYSNHCRYQSTFLNDSSIFTLQLEKSFPTANYDTAAAVS